MTEHALLTIRADLAPLDDDVRARLRAGVLDLVGLDADGVATITPAPGVTGITGITGIVREPVLIDTVGEDDDVIDLTDRTRERTRRLSGAGTPQRGRILLAAAAVLVALLVLGTGLSRQDHEPGTEVIATLSTATNGDELIAALGQAPDTPLPDGKYDYERVETGVPVGTGPQVVVRVTERWVDNRNSGRVAEGAEVLRASTDPGAASQPGPSAKTDNLYGAGLLRVNSLRMEDLRGLPSDPVALRAELFRLAQIDPTQVESLYTRIADLLALQATPPSVRVALARLLISDGATVVGQVKDRGGRTGLGISVALPDGRRRIFVLDVTTYRRLGDFTLAAGTSLDAAAALSWSTVLDNRIVGSTDAR